MFTFLLFIGFIFYIYYNHQQFSKLNKRIDELTKPSLPIIDTTSEQPSNIITETLPTELNSTEPNTISQNNDQNEYLDNLLAWLSKDWPMKIGGLFIILSIIWFVTYAFLNNWIGPAGRITIGLVTGSIIMIAGHWFALKQRHQGLILELIGSCINLVTIFSAQNLYQMFTPSTAILLTVGVMITITYSSLVHQDKYLASVAVIIGGIAPLLTGNYESNFLSLFSYLIALSLGSIWLSAFTNWRHLSLINLVIVWLYCAPYQYQASSLFNYFTPNQTIELKFFAISFTTLFFASNLATIYKSKIATHSDLFFALATSLFAFVWTQSLISPQWQSLALITIALTFLGGAVLLSQLSASPYPTYTYSASALFLLTCATMIQFDGPIEVVALTTIAVLIPIFTINLFKDQNTLALLLYFILPIFLSLPSLTSPRWNTGILHSDSFALIYLNLCLWVVGLFLKFQAPHILSNIKESTRQIAIFIIIIASIYSLTLTWLISHALLKPYFSAQLLTLSIYLIIGLFTYFYGQLNQKIVTYRYGQVLTILVIVWLLLVETSNMELVGRILTFAFTGVLLISSVLLLNKFKKNHE